jgi:hypothetical protein
VSELKLAKGSLKVILSDSYAIAENTKRTLAGGKRLIPPYIVLEHHEEQGTTDTHLAFEVHGKSLRACYNISKFPFSWALTKYANVRVWTETNDALTLAIEQ